MTNLLAGYHLPLPRLHRAIWLALGVAILATTSVWLPAWWQRAIFVAAGVVLLVVYLTAEKMSADDFPISPRTQKILLSCLLLALLVARLLPFTHSAIPLGYDTGLYREGIHRFAEALPYLPDRSATWAFERFQFLGYFIITDVLASLQLPLDIILYGSIIGIDLLLTWLLFRYTRERASSAHALIAAAFFAASLAHANLYWYFLAKNMLGLALLFPTLQYLQRKSWWTLPYALGVFLTHLPTSLVLIGLAAWVLVMQPRRKFALRLLVIAAIGAAPIVLLNWEKLWGTVRLIRQTGFTSTLPVEEGIFISVQQFWQAGIALVPLAIIGIIYLWRRNRDAVVPGVIGSVVYAATPLLFHVRFTVFVDVFMQTAAGVGLWQLFSVLVKKTRVRMAMLVGVVVVGAGAALAGGWLTRPLYSDAQLEALHEVPAAAKEQRVKIMVIDSIFAPLAYGWSDLPTIAPGMLEYPTWDKNNWQRFWSGSPEMQREMLVGLKQPLYIFDAGRQMPGLGKIAGMQRVNDYLYYFTLPSP